MADICAHMEIIKHDPYADDELRVIASSYATRKAFERGNRGAYSVAVNRGQPFMASICAHMESLAFSDDELRAIAKGFATRWEFKARASGAHNAARKRGKAFFEDICSHMATLKTAYTDDCLRACAAQFTRRGEFAKARKTEYVTAKNRGSDFFESICAHMDRGNGGFNPDRPGTLYFVEFSGPNGKRAWKAGITNRAAAERAKEYGLDPEWTATVLAEYRFDDGRACFEAEAHIKRAYKSDAWDECYDGDAFMLNGWTEVFTLDVLSAWRASQHGIDTLSARVAAEARA